MNQATTIGNFISGEKMLMDKRKDWGRKIFCFVVVLMIFLISGNEICAQGNIRIGKIEIHPYIGFKQYYDDNIFLMPDNEKEDWVSTITLGAKATQAGENHIFSFEYFADIIEYWEHSSQSTQNHHLSLLLDRTFSNKTFFTFDEHFVKTSDPATSELTERQERIRNNLSLTTGHKAERWDVNFNYTNTRDDYENLNQLDRYENVGTIIGHYRFLPKTSLLLEYNRGFITYDENKNRNNANYHQANVGIEGKWFPKMSGLFKIGHQWRKYKDNSNFDGGVALLNVQWPILARTSLSASGSWGVDESTFGINNYYRFDSTELGITQKMGRSWSLLLSGSHQDSKYPKDVTTPTYTGKREDKIRTVGIAGIYDIRRWLTMEIGYRYKTRNSNFNEFDYDDNQYYLEISADF